MGLNFGVVY